MDTSTHNTELKMTVNAMKIKLFGKVATLYRVLDSRGEVLQVLESQEEAEQWIAKQAK